MFLVRPVKTGLAVDQLVQVTDPARGVARGTRGSSPARPAAGPGPRRPAGRRRGSSAGPVINSIRSSTFSRSRSPAGRSWSRPAPCRTVPRPTRCEEIRLSSIISTRMTLARSGMLVRDAEQPLHRQAVGGLVEDRRQVVRPGAERDALGPGPELHVLLDAGVQVADARAGLGDGLAVQGQDQPEHAVRGRVLRAHVDDDVLVPEESVAWSAAATSSSQSWPETL